MYLRYCILYKPTFKLNKFYSPFPKCHTYIITKSIECRTKLSNIVVIVRYTRQETLNWLPHHDLPPTLLWCRLVLRKPLISVCKKVLVNCPKAWGLVIIYDIWAQHTTIVVFILHLVDRFLHFKRVWAGKKTREDVLWLDLWRWCFMCSIWFFYLVLSL